MPTIPNMTTTQERITGGYSLHTQEDPSQCPEGTHLRWREVYCDGDWDVIECSRCGQQKRVPCTFDDEYA